MGIPVDQSENGSFVILFPSFSYTKTNVKKSLDDDHMFYGELVHKKTPKCSLDCLKHVFKNLLFMTDLPFR